MSTSLIILRGSQENNIDHVFRCASHTSRPDSYVSVKVDDTTGQVLEKKLYRSSQVEDLEDYANSSFRGTVYVDSRESEDLLPIPNIDTYRAADLETIVRAKSEFETEKLTEVNALTQELLREHKDETSFRARAEEMGYRASFTVTEGDGFREYRGGLQTNNGLCSDVTVVEAKTQEWEDRLSRAYRGLDRVAELAQQENVSEEELQKTMESCMDQHLDRLVSSVAAPIGYQSRETEYRFRGTRAWDVLNIRAAVEDPESGEVAIVYRSMVSVLPQPVPEPEPEPVEIVKEDSSAFRAAPRRDEYMMPWMEALVV